MNKAMLNEILKTGLDNIPEDMPREKIIETLTNRSLEMNEGMIAMKSMWSNRFNDQERLDMMDECYMIMLHKWFDEELSDEPDTNHMKEITLVLAEINKNRVGVQEIMRIIAEKESMHESLMDKVLTEFDEDEMPRC